MSFNNKTSRENTFITPENLIAFKYHLYYFFLQEVLENILDLDVSVKGTSDFLQFVSGGKVIFGSIPLAHRYGGHQVTITLVFQLELRRYFHVNCALVIPVSVSAYTCKYVNPL